MQNVTDRTAKSCSDDKQGIRRLDKRYKRPENFKRDFWKMNFFDLDHYSSKRLK